MNAMRPESDFLVVLCCSGRPVACSSGDILPCSSESSTCTGEKTFLFFFFGILFKLEFVKLWCAEEREDENNQEYG